MKQGKKQARVKTPEQINFSELWDVLRDKGWSLADVGRALGYDKKNPNVAVNRILAGKSGVSEMRLEIMRKLAQNPTNPRTHVQEIEDKAKPFDDLQYLQEHNPPLYKSAGENLKVFRELAQKIQGVSSTVAGAAADSQASASVAARNAPRLPRRKREAGGPSVHKPKPARDVDKASKESPVAPAPAPTKPES